MNDHTPYFPDDTTEYAPWVAMKGLLAPYGQCQCGCGNLAPIAKTTRANLGMKRGKPVRFIHSHSHQVRVYERRPVEERFWKHVQRGDKDECWEWMASRDHDGYGKLSTHNATWIRAHRFSYELHNGPIPNGLEVLHRCDNPPCVNPTHLFLGTTSDNMNDKVAKGRQPRGHEIGVAKLTESDVVRVRELKAQGMQQKAIAKLFGVCEDTISSIVLRKKWKHVP